MWTNMWSKRNRLAVATTIYENLYWDHYQLDKEKWLFDADYLQEFLAGEKTDEISEELVREAVKEFYSRKPQIDLILKDYIEDNSKTFLIVYAVLCSFLVEREGLAQEEKERLVGKYIKLTQDLIAGGNTSLVHAILSKIQPVSGESGSRFKDSDSNTRLDRSEDEVKQ